MSKQTSMPTDDQQTPKNEFLKIYLGMVKKSHLAARKFERLIKRWAE